MIKFSPANSKLQKLEKKTNKTVYSFDLLSGVNCKFAKLCHAWVKIVKGKRKVIDGPHCKFRCYSASSEVLYPATYDYRKENDKILKKSFSEVVRTLSEALPEDADIVRVHSSGDFKSQLYFDAWLEIARRHPKKVFYAYTKALPYWIKRKKTIPSNFVLTASYGGTHDYMIKRHKLRYVKVVLSKLEAGRLPIDSDDSIAYNPGSKRRNFTVLIHGVQPAGSKEAKAMYKLRYNK